MSTFNSMMLAFNRGLISALALARIDIKRVALSADTFVNWMPRILGSMMLRPGLKYIAGTHNNLSARYLAFVFSNSETALLELTDSNMRVVVNDTIVTRLTVSTTIINPTFNADSDWIDNDEPGALSTIISGLDMTGTGYNKASRKQTITVSGGDANKEHALTIIVTRGSFKIRVGSTNGGIEYVNDITLLVGDHSIAFTPAAGNVFIELFTYNNFLNELTSIFVASPGPMVIPTSWGTSNLDDIRTAQSGDVIFVACKNVKQHRIERHAAGSWSVVDYVVTKMPLRSINLTTTRMTYTLTHAVNGTSTAEITSSPTFILPNSDQFFKLTFDGQQPRQIVGGSEQWCGPIQITGVGAGDRTFDYTVGVGDAVGTVSLQKSTDKLNWHAVATKNAAVPAVTTLIDTSDNLVVYYRFGFNAVDANYTSGSVILNFDYGGGVHELFFKFGGSVNSLGSTITSEVLTANKTRDWEEGVWSSFRGYPTAVALYQGRLWWAGADSIYGSDSDDYTSFNIDLEGDAGPVIRTIGQGPIDSLKWMAPSSTLVLGGDISEYSVESGSGGPVTGTDINIKRISTQGSADVPSGLLDDSTIFADRSGSRLFEVMQRDGYQGVSTEDIALTVPEIGLPGISRIAIQRKPDTRIHCVRTDGTAALLVHDRAEDVRCWLNFTTDGLVTDVVILPSLAGTGEDQVYYLIKRTLATGDKYYLEKWALESNCQGGTQNHQADSFTVYTGAATTAMTGLGHLEGGHIVIWQDGKDAVDTNGDIKLFTVIAGDVTLDVAASNVVMGLPYKAQFKSTKLAETSELGTPLNQVKIVDHIGLILRNTHFKGLTYGRDFDNQDTMPDTRDYLDQADGTLFTTYDEQAFEFAGSWDTDSRVCLEANAPRPCTLLALTLSIRQHDR